MQEQKSTLRLYPSKQVGKERKNKLKIGRKDEGVSKLYSSKNKERKHKLKIDLIKKISFNSFKLEFDSTHAKVSFWAKLDGSNIEKTRESFFQSFPFIQLFC